jgi:hypothetical protein
MGLLAHDEPNQIWLEDTPPPPTCNYPVSGLIALIIFRLLLKKIYI